MANARLPAHPPISLFRVCVIAFWLLVMTVVWIIPGYMPPAARLFVTAWFSGIAFAGLIVLHNLSREMLREQRLASGHCVECGYDLRYTQHRCPECGMAPKGLLTMGEFEMLQLVRETYGANIASERIIIQARDTNLIAKLQNEKLHHLRVNLTHMARQRKKGASRKSLKSALRFD